jgi:hypothetical protein
VKAKGKRQKSKGKGEETCVKNESSRRKARVERMPMTDGVSEPLVLIFAFCPLPFDFLFLAPT